MLATANTHFYSKSVGWSFIHVLYCVDQNIALLFFFFLKKSFYWHSCTYELSEVQTNVTCLCVQLHVWISSLKFNSPAVVWMAVLRFHYSEFHCLVWRCSCAVQCHILGTFCEHYRPVSCLRCIKMNVQYIILKQIAFSFDGIHCTQFL